LHWYQYEDCIGSGTCKEEEGTEEKGVEEKAPKSPTLNLHQEMG
jgi:hypothetical protein